jgi:hypothetical protein
VAIDTGLPVKRARVVTSGAAGGARAVLTDEAGRYEITRLVAGAVIVSASKEGLVATSYGQRSWPGNGTSLTLREGQRIDHVDIALPRGGVVTGRALDEFGEPLVGATVRAWRILWLNGGVRAAPGGSDIADDRGVYRVFGLTPGSYYVSATRATTAGERALSADRDIEPVGGTSVGYAPTYHPSGASLAEATAVRVKAGQETTGIDVNVRLVTLAEVSGSVVTPDPSARVSVSLIADGQAGFGPTPFEATVFRDGTFRFADVPPGQYLAFAEEMGSGGRLAIAGVGTRRFALQPVLVAGQNVRGLTITLGTGGTVTGTVSFEATRSQPPTDLGGFRVVTTGARSLIGMPGSASQVHPDGTFTLTNVPPLPVLLDVVVPTRAPDARASGWQLKGIYLGGREITDTPIQVSQGQSLSDVLVVFSDSVSGLAGEVRQGSQPAASSAVLVFSSDPALWRMPQSRYLRMARTDPQGHFDIHPLPPGRYYVQALVDIDPLQWTNPDVLDRLRETASVVTVNENETKTISLFVGVR